MPKKIQRKKSAWDVIDDIPTGGTTQFEDRNGFSKKDVNFYVPKNETVEVVILSDPIIKEIHRTKKTVKVGERSFPIYPVEVCQKEGGERTSCLWCDESKQNNAVGRHKKGIFVVLLSVSGKYKDGKFDGDPHPFIWADIPVSIAKQLRELKDELEEDDLELHDVVLKLKKVDKVTTVDYAKIKTGSGKNRQERIKYIDTEITEKDGEPDEVTIFDEEENEIYSGKLPIISEIYSTPDDKYVEREISYL